MCIEPLFKNFSLITVSGFLIIWLSENRMTIKLILSDVSVTTFLETSPMVIDEERGKEEIVVVGPQGPGLYILYIFVLSQYIKRH